MTKTTEQVTEGLSPELRARMALALDVDDLVEAVRLARQLSPWFGVAKVGLELYTAAGPDAVGVGPIGDLIRRKDVGQPGEGRRPPRRHTALWRHCDGPDAVDTRSPGASSADTRTSRCLLAVPARTRG